MTSIINLKGRTIIASSVIIIYLIFFYYRDFKLDSVAYFEYYEMGLFVFEPVFTGLMQMCSSFDFSGRDFLIVIAIINIILVISLSHSTNPNQSKIFILAIWFSSLWGISISTNAIRQGMAELIFYVGFFLTFLIKAQKSYIYRSVLFIIFTTTAIGIHTSIILLLPLTLASFYLRLNNEKFRFFLPLLLFICSYLIPYTLLIPEFFHSFIHSESFEGRAPSYLKFLSIYFFYLFYTYLYKNIRNDYVYDIAIRLYFVLLLAVSFFSQNAEIISRINVFLWPLDLILINNYLYLQRLNKNLFYNFMYFTLPIFGIFNPSSQSMI